MLLTWGNIVRILRRRIVLAIIFAISFTYCALSLLARDSISSPVAVYNNEDDDDGMTIDNEDLPLDEDLDDEISGKNFPWPVSDPNDKEGDATNTEIHLHINASDDALQFCRNSVQGKSLIVDERGFVCARQDVLPMGCCKEDQDATLDVNNNSNNSNNKTIVRRERYSCETCNTQGCCAVYEYCVSCCLHPSRRKLKKNNQVGRTRRENQKSKKMEDVIKLRFRSLDRFQVCLAACRTSSASVRHENTYKDPHSKHCYYNSPGNILHRRDLISAYNNNGGNDAITSFSTVSLIILTKYSSHLINTTYSVIHIFPLFFIILIQSRNCKFFINSEYFYLKLPDFYFYRISRFMHLTKISCLRGF